ncbi:MAG: flagellar biosynthesis anti-sigma factor FlgM [Armatimonadota bacterium]
MQIDPTHLSRIASASIAQSQAAAPAAVETSATAAASATAPASAATGADQVLLSQQATEVQGAYQALAQTPEVRSELVAQLKAQVQAGTYQVDAEKIAEKLVG